jgi:hypothetical protein
MVLIVGCWQRNSLVVADTLMPLDLQLEEIRNLWMER